MPKAKRMGKAKTRRVQDSNKAEQLQVKAMETTVHTSLPPLVKGAPKGHLRVCVEEVLWKYSIGPPTSKLCVKLKWWGEKSPGTIFRVPVRVQQSGSDPTDSSAVAYFPVRSGLAQLKAYLKDMGGLTFQLGLGHMTDDSMVIGQSHVPVVATLLPASSIRGLYPILNSNGTHLGQLRVDIRLQMATSIRGTTNPAQKPLSRDSNQPLLPHPSPEFIIGPGTTSGNHGRHVSSLSRSEVDTAGSKLNRQSKTPELPQKSFPSDEDRKVQLASKGSSRHAVYDVPQSGEEGGGAIGYEESVMRKGGEGGVGAMTSHSSSKQIEVISELIERGKKLRDTMVESVVDAHISGSRDTEKENETPCSNTLPLLSMELAQRERSRKASVKHNSSSRKAQQGPAITHTDKDMVDLILMEEAREDKNVYADLSSDDDDSGGDDIVGEDFSMNESDYPLYSDSLLQDLLYSNEPVILASMNTNTDQNQTRHKTTVVESHPDENTDQTPLQDSSTSTSSSKVPPNIDIPIRQSKSSSEPTRHDPAPSLGAEDDDSSKNAGGSSDSLSTLSSFFGKGDKSLESAILRNIGMEKMTKLGRVSSARVTIESLQLDPSAVERVFAAHKKKRTASKIPQPAYSALSATYFVEYQFPAMVKAKKSRLPSREVMRIASKKMKNGVVCFNHHSVFPILFDGPTIRQWWNNTLIFRLYCRPSSERMPFLVGKCVVTLRRWLTSSSLCLPHCVLDVRASSLAAAVSGGVAADDPSVGKLEVSLELVGGKQKKATDQELQQLPSIEEESVGAQESDEDSSSQAELQPVRLREKALSLQDAPLLKKPTPLQLLLLIPQGTALTAPSLRTTTAPPSLRTTTAPPASKPACVPNCYLVCKLFCAPSPHPKTPVQWASSEPQFAFKQVYTLYLTPSLMEQVCDNFTVVEVWHKTPGSNTEDELIGLVKVSLHQFYLAYSDDSSAQLCQQAQLPVIAMDSYCPIVDPFSGAQCGYLALLLALGSASQVTALQQQFASGAYTLQQPHVAQTGGRSQPVERRRRPHSEQSTTLHHSTPGDIHHVFGVTVEGVRAMASFSSTVWGEADCFVQYHFPATTSDGDCDADIEVSLETYRTGTTLCVPDPTLSYETRHTLALPVSHPVQRELMTTCGSGGVTFELWKRFYYPNIRDQLVAKACLPLAKLCAMVTMQKMASANVQSFSLPLKLVSEDTKAMSEDDGLLDITVSYEAFADSSDDNEQVEDFEKTHVNISVGIFRATGLKDAAELASSSHPVPLGFAAEAGVNSYAKIDIPDLLQEKRTTKTIARTFAPEFSHFFDIPLPLTVSTCEATSFHHHHLHRRKPPHHLPSASATRPSSPLAKRLAEGFIIIEIWHEVPKKGVGGNREAVSGDIAGPGLKVIGRRLGPTFRDVLLGYVELPLMDLLEQHTGIHGWFSLLQASNTAHQDACSPVGGDDDSSSPPTPYLSKCVGGVELSVSFSSKDDRKLVLSRALKMGWKLPKNSTIDVSSLLPHNPIPIQLRKGGMESDYSTLRGGWSQFEMRISSVWLQLDRVVLPSEGGVKYKYCFVRYRFFDKSAVVSAPKQVTYSKDGVACYQLKHKAQLSTVDSEQIEWYLNEESLEVQVWASAVAKKSVALRPQADDTLLGVAYVPLHGLLKKREETQLSGCYHLFKAGVDRLGYQAVRVEIRRTFLQPQRGEIAEHTSVNILDSSLEEDDDTTKGGSDVGGEDEVIHSKTSPAAESYKDMFEARIVIHQALHLPEYTNSKLADQPPSAYVTLHPHPSLEKISTAVAKCSQKPSWNHQCITHIPNLYLQAQCPGLEFQVWNKVVESAAHQVKAVSDDKDDSYIGSVHIDMSPLCYGLSQICGWYNIVDFGGQVQGQLKVSVVPTQRISFPSALLSIPVHVSTSMLSKSKEFTSGVFLLERSSVEQPSSTRSVLFRQLRENIHELDKIHQTLQAKLYETEVHHPNTSAALEPVVTGLAGLEPVVTGLAGLEPVVTGLASEKHSVHTEEYRIEGFPGLQISNPEAPLFHSIKPTTTPELHNQVYTQHPGDSQSSLSQEEGLRTVTETIQSNHNDRSTIPELNEQVSTHPEGDSQCSLSQEGAIQASPREQANSNFDGRSQEDFNVLPLETSSTSSVDSTAHSTASLTDISSCSRDDSPLLTTPLQGFANPNGNQRENGIEELEDSFRGDCTSSDDVRSQPMEVSERDAHSESSVSDFKHPQTPLETQTAPLTPKEVHHPALQVSPNLENKTAAKATAPTTQTAPLLKDNRQSTDDAPLLKGSCQSEEALEPGDGSRRRGRPPLLKRKGLPAMHSQLHPEQGNPIVKDVPQLSSSSAELPEAHFPNFFMPPHQLEQAMRSLRASTLSRAPPRRRVIQSQDPHLHEGSRPPHSYDDYPDTDHKGTPQSLKEVRKYLESRRKAENQVGNAGDLENRMASKAAATQRLFSSKPSTV